MDFDDPNGISIGSIAFDQKFGNDTFILDGLV